MSLIEDLRQISLFEFLDLTLLEELAGIVSKRRYSRGEVIFGEGEEGKGFFGIVSGLVKVFKLNLNGREHILHLLGPGDIFAEAILSREEPVYPAHALCLRDCELLFFPRDRFQELIKENFRFSLGLFTLFSQRLRQLVHKIEELSLKEVPSRLATYLLLLSKSQGSREVYLSINKMDLALYLGTTPETLSRAIKKLKQKGVLSVKGRRMVIEDEELLSDIAIGNFSLTKDVFNNNT